MIMSQDFKYTVLLLGSGGREHAIAWAIYKDERIDKLYCAPGNAGTLGVAENVDLDIMCNDSILHFVIDKNTKNEYLLGGMGSWGFVYAP